MDHINGEDEDVPPITSPSNPNPNPNPSKHARIMQNLKAAVFARFAESHPNTTLSPSQIAAVEFRLAQAFPTFQTPTHPTYPSMIRKSIEELKEEGGSSEGSISDYILKNFTGLPWAHRSYLSRYLGKLCESGEIVRSVSNCYTIPGLIIRPESKKRLLRGRKRKEVESDEGGLGGEGVVEIEENELRVFKRKTPKRRRSLLVFEDEDVEEQGRVEKEDDVIRNSATPGIEGEEKRLLLTGGVEVGKESEVMQCEFGMNDNGGDEVAGLKEVAIVESIGEKLMHKEGRDEVSSEVLALDHDDLIEGKTELLNLSNTKKMLPDECVNGVGTETRHFDCESGDANLMLIPIESKNNSALEEDTRIDTCGDVSGETLKKPAIMESDDHSLQTSDLMIVPFKGDCSLRFAKQKEKEPSIWEYVSPVVCALPSPQVAVLSKPKQLVYRQKSRKRQKKALPVLDNAQSDSPVCPTRLQFGRNAVSPHTSPETKLDQTLQDPLMPLLIEQAQTSSPQGTTSMILVEGGSRILESEKATSYLEPLPSSGTEELMSDDIPLNQVLQKCSKHRKLSEGIPKSRVVTLVKGPPGVENPAKTLPQRRKKELSATKRKQKQRQTQKCDALEAGSGTAPERGSFFSFHMEKGDMKKRQEDQEPHAQGRCILDGQHHDLGENQQKTKDYGLHLSAELEQTSKVGLKELSPPENQNGPKQADGQPLGLEPLSAKQGSLCESARIEQQTKDESQVGVMESDPQFTTLVDVEVRASIQIPQEQNKEKKIERRGRPRKQKEYTKDQKNEQPKKDGRQRPRKKKEETREVAAPLIGYDQLQEGRSEPLVIKDGDGSPWKEKEETTGNVASPLGLHYQKKGRPTHQLSAKVLKKDGKARPRKEGLVHKEPKKIRRGRSQKAEGTKENEATVSYQEEELNKKEEQHKGTYNPEVIFKQSALSGKSLLGNQSNWLGNQSNWLGNQSNWYSREQKQHGQEDEPHCPDEQPRKSQGQVDEVLCSEELIVNETPEQKQHGQEDEPHCPDEQPRKSQGQVDVALCSEEQLTVNETPEQKQHGQEDEPHCPDEQPRESQGQVDAALCSEEQLTVNETLEQLEEQKEDGGCQLSGVELVTAAAIDPSSQEEKQSQLQHDEKEGLSSIDQGKTPKQKSGKSKAIEVPLSSKTSLRSQGQVDATLCSEEQLTVNETPEQLEKQKEEGGCELSGVELVTAAAIDPPSQEEKQSQLQHDEKEEGRSSIDQGKTPKQKSAKSKAIEVPLSSKTSLRSRTNR